ncbi:ATP-binding cassette domain-containing protein, partial [Streptomyces brasiliscabiei]|uniref:ATP-binding cassette domain-containing protein n=1 Tax=Streptomyces brasiliscabiei TaxID=2736302 RepID=UPI0030154433
AVVVSDVSLEIRPGEFIGLVGESGSGKSTLVRAILGLLPVSEGRIAIGGRSWTDLRGRERRAVRSTLQTVFQDPHGAFD